MVAEKDNIVSIVYELRSGSKKGEIVESLALDKPMTFLFGTGGLLPKFEEKLNGLSTDDSFDFLLNSEDAYGPVVETAVVQVPKSVFEVDGQTDEKLMQVGNTVPMMDAEGRRLNGIVIAIEGDGVKMDFNHPMAGTNLHFTGKVTEIRNATEEELMHGHIHSNGSDCGSCDDTAGHSCSCGC